MVRRKKEKGNFYYVQCGDWEGFAIALNAREACVSALSQAIEMFGDNVKMTNVTVCYQCNETMDSQDVEPEAFLSESLLEDIYEH